MSDRPDYLVDRQWSRDVREMMRNGLGVEDIAVRLACSVAEVRREADLLRRTGVLGDLYRGRA